MNEKQILAEFEEEFEKNYKNLLREEEYDSTVGDGGTYTVLDADKVKAFTKQFLLSTLTRQKEEQRKEIVEDLEELDRKNPSLYDTPEEAHWGAGYHQAIVHILSSLQEKETECPCPCHAPQPPGLSAGISIGYSCSHCSPVQEKVDAYYKKEFGVRQVDKTKSKRLDKK